MPTISTRNGVSINHFYIWLTLTLLSGCGGGSDTAASNDTIVNRDPPMVVGTSPLPGAVAVDGCGMVSANFSKAMDTKTFAAAFTLKTGAGSAVQGGVTASADGRTATFTPSAPLADGTSYIATVSTAVRDNAGLALAADKVWAFTAGVCAATANTFFVAPAAAGGNDANPGTEAQPFATLSRAVNAVGPGDLIRVRAGSYDRVNIGSRQGSASAWIRMRPYGDGEVIIRGSNTAPSVYFYTSACDEYPPAGAGPCAPVYWILEGLTIRGSASGGGDGNAVKIDTPGVKLISNKLCCAYADVVKLVRSANDVELLGNEIWQDDAVTVVGVNAQGIDIVGADRTHVAFNYLHDILTNPAAGQDPGGIGMYAKGNARDTVFENNRIVNVDSHAMMLGQSTDAARLVDGPYESYDGIMRNNIVIGADWGCFATASSSGVKIYNNSCYNVARTASAAILVSNESELGQTGRNIEIKNNIVYAAAAAARPLANVTADALESPGTLSMSNNLYWAGAGAVNFRYAGSTLNFTQWKTTSGTDTNSTVANPDYASFLDLTLNAASPAIDAGLTVPFVTIDFLGAMRPNGAAADIGAYEYQN